MFRDSWVQEPHEGGDLIARHKFGELLVRLCICGQAANETHRAAQFASYTVQSEMALNRRLQFKP